MKRKIFISLIAALLCVPLLCVAVVAAEKNGGYKWKSHPEDADISTYTTVDKKPEKTSVNGPKVYVSSVGRGTGMTCDSPISDLAAAYDMLRGTDGTIVLINQVKISKSFHAPKHESRIVITSYDGEKYFNGGLKFGKGLYFRFGGDTVVENTAISYTGDCTFVCGFNNVTFGTGLDTPDISKSGLNVVGGYHLDDNADKVLYTLAKTVTVESGNYERIVGYTTGTEADRFVHKFKGTQTLQLNGGKIKQVCGGPTGFGNGEGVIINVDGAEITEYIHVGGARPGKCNNATVNIKSGYVKLLDMRNVAVKTVINLTGGTVDKFECYNRAEGAKYILNYENVTVPAEALALFDEVNDKLS
ncbi:MAG: hypothetical protein IJN63_10310 [Clostridia bacterium]|nr:hypothetical protein [Clostridia bacterium]